MNKIICDICMINEGKSFLMGTGDSIDLCFECFMKAFHYATGNKFPFSFTNEMTYRLNNFLRNKGKVGVS